MEIDSRGQPEKTAEIEIPAVDVQRVIGL